METPDRHDGEDDAGAARAAAPQPPLRAPGPQRARHARATAATTALIAFGVYLLTLAPSVYWYDSAEFAAKAVHLEIPHPPGYPLYIVVAHLFTWLPFEPAYSLNLLSALAGSCCVAFVVLAGFELGLGATAAATGGMLLAASYTFWENSIIAEAYTPGLAFAAAALWLLLRAVRERRSRLVPLAALVAAIGTGAHLSIATLGLGYVALAWQGAGDLGRERNVVMLRCALFALAGGAGVYLLIPLSQPALLFEPAHWRWSWMMMSGGPFWEHFDETSQVDPWLRAGRMLFGELGLFGILLAGGGIFLLAQRERLTVAGLLLGIAGNVVFFADYEVHDLEVFFLPSVMLLSLLAAAGADGLVQLAGGVSQRVGQLAAVGLFVVPASLALANATEVDKSHDLGAREFGERLVRELPQHALLLTWNSPAEWHRHSVWLYFQRGLGERPDVRTRYYPQLSEVLCYLDAGHAVFAFSEHEKLLRAHFELEEWGAGELLRVKRTAAHGALRSPGAAYRPGPEPPSCE